MICLANSEGIGNAVYLDVHHAERKGEGPFLVSGILGDGWYEGEVVIEVGERIDVTFADEWLDRGALEEFFLRMEKEEVCRFVREKITPACFCLENFPAREGQPRERVTAMRFGGRTVVLPPKEYGEQLDLPLGVASGGVEWAA